MKKFVIFGLALMLTFCLGFINLSGGATFAKSNEESLKIEGKASILMDAKSGKILYAENEDTRYPIASMTKIMTLLLTFEEIEKGNLKLDEEIIVSETASGMGGSQVFLDANTAYKASDLVKSVVVSSANDASVALAEKISGSEQAFVKAMNEKAKALGLTNTNFANATGLPAPEGYSSAKDVSIMFQNLIKHNEYFNFSKIYLDTLTHPSGRETQLSNTNKLVKFYEGCDAGKTGSTSEAKFCLCATAKRGDSRLIACVIGSENAKIRNAQITKLFNYGFANFKNVVYVENGASYNLTVEGGKSLTATAVSSEGFEMLIGKGEANSVVVTENIDKVIAPRKKGDVVGEIIISKDGKVLKTINLVLNEDVKANGFLDNIKNIFNKWAI